MFMRNSVSHRPTERNGVSKTARSQSEFGNENTLLVLLLVLILVRLALRLLHKGVDRLLQRLAAEVLVADDPFRVDDVDGRPAVDVPLGGDRPVRAAVVPERPPGDVLFLDRLLELPTVLVTVDADNRERLVFVLLHERPLVRVH